MKLPLLLLPLLLGALQAAESTKPNVIVMIVDGLGSGDVSCLFRNVVKTPNIDRLAKNGVKFTSGYVTAPVCGPSRAGFFTGRYNQHLGFNENNGGIQSAVAARTEARIDPNGMLDYAAARSSRRRLGLRLC
jgi:arylsulfatase A-like enzyme